MGKDLLRGAAVGLVAGPGIAYPVSRLYREDFEAYEAMPLVVLAVVLVVPAGWLLARALRIAHPVRAALLAPVLLHVTWGAAGLAAPDLTPRLVMAGLTALAVMSYAAAAWLTRTASPLPRLVAAMLVAACVITTSTVEHRRDEDRDRRLRAELIAFYRASIPLVVPETVPGRRLTRVWTISDDLLALDYAREAGGDAEVFVRIERGGDPRAACAAWDRDGRPCARQAADRWLSPKGPHGRLVLFARVEGHLVAVDSTRLTPGELLAVVEGGLRPVSAEYLVDFAPPWS